MERPDNQKKSDMREGIKIVQSAAGDVQTDRRKAVLVL